MTPINIIVNELPEAPSEIVFSVFGVFIINLN